MPNWLADILRGMDDDHLGAGVSLYDRAVRTHSECLGLPPTERQALALASARARFLSLQLGKRGSMFGELALVFDAAVEGVEARAARTA